MDGVDDGAMTMCGATEAAADPPEMVAARKLRSIPFLSNEEIEQISEKDESGIVVASSRGAGARNADREAEEEGGALIGSHEGAEYNNHNHNLEDP